MSSVEDFGFIEDFENEEIGMTLKTLILMRELWSVKTFVFVVSFSLSWVIGNIILLKGVEEKLRKHFPSDAHLKSYTYPIFRVKSLEISYSSVHFFSDRRRSSSLWWICSDWGVRNSPVRIAYTVRNMIALRILLLKFRSLPCYAPAVPKYLPT